MESIQSVGTFSLILQTIVVVVVVSVSVWRECAHHYTPMLPPLPLYHPDASRKRERGRGSWRWSVWIYWYIHTHTYIYLLESLSSFDVCARHNAHKRSKKKQEGGGGGGRDGRDSLFLCWAALLWLAMYMLSITVIAVPSYCMVQQQQQQ